MQINDGRGSSRAAGVNNENRLEVASVSASIEHHINHFEEKAFNVLFSQSPAANDDCIFYMENTNGVDLVMEGITISVNAVCDIYMKTGDIGTRNSPAKITPVNCNAGSGKEALGIFEMGTDLDGGSATLGGGIIVEKFVFLAAESSNHHNFEQDIIIPKNKIFTIWCSSSAATVTCTLPFNYHHDHV